MFIRTYEVSILRFLLPYRGIYSIQTMRKAEHFARKMAHNIHERNVFARENENKALHCCK